METSQISKAEYLLRKLIITGADNFSQAHPWLWENDRLSELIFAVFTQVADFDHEHLRLVTKQLHSMGLINLKVLSEIPIQNEEQFKQDQHVLYLIEILSENEFTQDEAKKATIILCELARGLNKNYFGKVQKLLRSYGELLLGDLKNNFDFSLINDKQVRTAFTYWLQNVANIPLPMDNDIILEFAEQNGVHPTSLMEAADHADINLAFLDDLIYSYMNLNKKM